MSTKSTLKAVHSNAKTEVAPSVLATLKIEMPKSEPYEEAIIGALMLDKTAYDTVKEFIPHKNILSDKGNQTVFRAIKRLIGNNKPVDLLTVSDEIQKMDLLGDRTKPPKLLNGRKLKAFLTSAVTPHCLVELTNRVASTANIEAHSAILHQLYMRREAIQLGLKIVKEAGNMSKDIFETYTETQKNFRASNPSKVIQLKTMNEAMKAGKAAPPSKWVAGNLFKENEVAILFADAGDGKSVFAFQVADAVSKGEPIFRNCDHIDFINQCEPKLTYFYDFELEESELFGRYSMNGEAYNFSDNFVRGQLDPNFIDFENADQLIADEIQRDIEINEPEFIVIDNLTYITTESQDSTIATKLMKRLLGIQKRSKKSLTILVIAHTPKRDPSMPILMRNLAGSMNLANFAKSIVAIAKSSQDPSKRYIKHIKCRNGLMLHGHENVIECTIEKAGSRLEYEFLDFSKESEHLMTTTVSRENEEEAIERALSMRQKGSGFRDIAKKLKELELVFWSHMTVKRKLKKYAANHTDPIFDEIDEKIDKALDAKIEKKDAETKNERLKIIEGQESENEPESPSNKDS
jgi:replicative DNA helicase